MSINAFLGIASFSKLAGPADDDLIDRLNHIYTVVLLILFATVSTGGQFVDGPIDCMMPGNFYGSYTSYTKSYCWVKNTYYIPLDSSVPVNVGKRQEAEVKYYQWMPIILLFMALLFKLPCIIWRVVKRGYAINLDKMSSLISSLDVGHAQKRKDSLFLMAQYIDRWLNNRRVYRDDNTLFRVRRCCRMFSIFGGKRDGTFLTALYLVIKLMYVANVIGQFFMLDSFMGGWFSLYGVEVVQGILSNSGWTESHRFPRVTLCDVQMRQLENVQRFTVQCVMPINMLNEKIFIFLWFWMCLVAFATTVNFGIWVFRIAFVENRVSYMSRYLSDLGELKDEEDKKHANKFVTHYLREDGVLVVRLVANNCNELLLSEAVAALWKLYRDKQKVSDGDKKSESKLKA